MVPSRIWRLWTVVFFSFGAGRRGRRRRGLRDMMWRDFWTIFENINEIVCSGGRRGLEDLEDFEWLWRTLKQPQFMLALTDWATYQPGGSGHRTPQGGVATAGWPWSRDFPATAGSRAGVAQCVQACFKDKSFVFDTKAVYFSNKESDGWSP